MEQGPPSHSEPPLPRASGLVTLWATSTLEVGIPGGQVSTLSPDSQDPEAEEWVRLGNLPARRGTWPHLVFLELAQRPHCAQMPAGATAVRQGVHDLLNGDHPLRRGRGGPHGWRGIGDPGTPVILQRETDRNPAAACLFPTLTPAPIPLQQAQQLGGSRLAVGGWGSLLAGRILNRNT